MSADRWTRTDHSLALELVQKVDHRQVMAIDREAGDGAPPFFLHEGEADLIRDDVQRGRFLCPLETCSDRVFHFPRGGGKRDHFVHKHAPTLHDSGELQTTLAVELLMRWFRHRGCAVVPIDVRPGDTIGVVLVERSGSAPVLTRVIVAWGPLRESDVHRVTEETWDAGFEVMWFIGVPSQLVTRPSYMSGSVMRLSEAARAIQDIGAPLWLFNPTKEWGLGAVEPDPDLLGGMIRVRALPLWACALGIDGLMPPEPDDPVVARMGQEESVRQARLARQEGKQGPSAGRRRTGPAARVRRVAPERHMNVPYPTRQLLDRSIRRVVTIGAPDAAREVVDEEVCAPLVVEHVRMNLRALGQFQARDTLLLVFGSSRELNAAEIALRPLQATTALFPREKPFTYRELNDVIDLLR